MKLNATEYDSEENDEELSSLAVFNITQLTDLQRQMANVKEQVKAISEKVADAALRKG